MKARSSSANAARMWIRNRPIGRAEVDGSAHEVADVELDAHPLEVFQHEDAIGESAEGPVELGEDDVVAGAKLGEEFLAGVALLPGDLAGRGGVDEERQVAELVVSGVAVLDLFLGLGRVHLLPGTGPAVAEDAGRVAGQASSPPSSNSSLSRPESWGSTIASIARMPSPSPIRTASLPVSSSRVGHARGW